MKKARLLLVLSVILFLVGCNNSKTVIINLYLDNDIIYDTYELEKGTDLVLPMHQTSDEKIYVGWSDEEDIFSKQITVTKDLNLYLVQENIVDVFDFGENTSNQEAYTLYDYTGEALYLTIPEKYHDKPIVTISSNAFDGNDLVEVYLSNYINYVMTNAFANLEDLEKVEFYGEVSEVFEKLIPQSELNSILEEAGDTCSIAEESDSVTIYSEGCSIISSTINNVITIDGVDYISYKVTMDVNSTLDSYYQYLYDGSFANCPKLNTVVLPYGNVQISQPFIDTPSLINIQLTNDLKYLIEDSVLYSLDKTVLYYYPSALESEAFTVPESVKVIWPNSFCGNSYIKTIEIGSQVSGIASTTFTNTNSLEAINVDTENETYSSVDGVLFENYGENIYGLTKYPENKDGSTYTIPSNVTYINHHSFIYNKNLEEIVIPNNVTIIGTEAFAYSEKLIVLDLPETIELIGLNMIEGSSVEVFILRTTVASTTELPNLSSLFELGTTMDLTIYLPDSSIPYYVTNQYWAFYDALIEPLSTYNAE